MHSSNRAYEGGIRVNGRPVKEVHHRGRTYIEGRKGTEYSLHFKNTTSKPVLVIPSVDGLCVLDGKPAGRSSPGVIVDPYDSIDVTGWMVDRSTAAKFTFWPQDARGEKTYVEELSKSGATVDVGNQGLIGFLVIEEKERPVIRSVNLNANRRYNTDYPQTKGWIGSGAKSSVLGISASYANVMDTVMSASVGTKFGKTTEFNTTKASFERGSVGGEIVLEYDTLRGLKDRGVPTDLFKGSGKLYGSRSAFPADDQGCTPPAGWNK